MPEWFELWHWAPIYVAVGGLLGGFAMVYVTEVEDSLPWASVVAALWPLVVLLGLISIIAGAAAMIGSLPWRVLAWAWRAPRGSI